MFDVCLRTVVLLGNATSVAGLCSLSPLSGELYDKFTVPRNKELLSKDASVTTCSSHPALTKESRMQKRGAQSSSGCLNSLLCAVLGSMGQAGDVYTACYHGLLPYHWCESDAIRPKVCASKHQH